MDIYVNRSIDRRWRKELGTDATGVKVFSPYITSNTAESVMAQLNGGGSEIHTRFEAELFAMGASSLSTLKKLAEQGHSLFHLNRLHAKIIIIPGRFVSVGSQNLTRGGTGNKEASVAFNDSAVVTLVEKLIKPWLDQRTPITPQMITDMEELLPEAGQLYATAQAAAEVIDKKIWEFRAAREEKARLDRLERQQMLERLQEHEQRLSLMRKSLRRAPGSNVVASGKVRDVTNSDSYSRTASLVVERDHDLTSWWVDGHQIKLGERTRYLCINEDNGKIGWARVVRTRITFVAKNVALGQVEVAGRLCHITLEADWSRRPWRGRNATVEIRSLAGQLICKASIGFSTQGIAVIHVSPAKARAQDQISSEWTTWVNENRDAFVDSILFHFTAPFIYEAKLRGSKADKFFGPIGRQFLLRVVSIEGHPVVTSRSIR